MAEHACSTGAPFAPPPCPLPANASPAWRDLWDSVLLIHPRIDQAIASAYAAGVNPAEVCLIQLASRVTGQTMPRLWFGDSDRSPEARVFSPAGEVTA
jgi:hypothetical protein